MSNKTLANFETSLLQKLPDFDSSMAKDKN